MHAHIALSSLSVSLSHWNHRSNKRLLTQHTAAMQFLNSQHQARILTRPSDTGPEPQQRDRAGRSLSGVARFGARLEFLRTLQQPGRVGRSCAPTRSHVPYKWGSHDVLHRCILPSSCVHGHRSLRCTLATKCCSGNGPGDEKICPHLYPQRTLRRGYIGFGAYSLFYFITPRRSV